MTKSDDLGKLILRVALGVLILLHGIAKLSKGVDGIGGMLSSHGLPAILAYLVYVGEVVAPVLLIVGLFTRPAAWVVAANMLVAIWLVHMKDLGALNNQGGWALELQGMFLFSAIAVAFLGGGRLGIGGRFN
ncbi:DoxX family protein [Xenophilus azovorans]|uniref:DoxX family protein n=1 Tax=Xenophilus TaxID=151754 RepID=UPI0005713C6F|nr:DoxX family protein [Xenophilus azovorans]